MNLPRYSSGFNLFVECLHKYLFDSYILVDFDCTCRSRLKNGRTNVVVFRHGIPAIFDLHVIESSATLHRRLGNFAVDLNCKILTHETRYLAITELHGNFLP